MGIILGRPNRYSRYGFINLKKNLQEIKALLRAEIFRANCKRILTQTVFFNVEVKVAQCTFEICKNNGFEHEMLDYYCVLKGKEYHSGMQ